MTLDTTAYVLLEDGARFDGLACGAERPAVGEIVFTTSMSGYQEAMTDPSYAGQLITFTYPQIGNYGVSPEAMESDRVHARAAIMRAAVDRDDAPGAQSGWLRWLVDAGVPAITDLDTRALVRHIRDAGAMRGGLFPASVGEARARDLIEAEPSMTGRDLAREVTPAEPVVSRATGSRPRPADRDDRHRRQALDRRKPEQRGATVELHPCTASPGELLANRPDAMFLANGPGDPARAGLHRRDRCASSSASSRYTGSASDTSCCAGRSDCETYKLPFGHHGANHPVKDLTTGRTEITSQNHGFAVLGPDGAADDRRRRAGPLGDRLRRRRAEPHQPLRPNRRGAAAARCAGRDRPVPPRSRARSARRPVPVRSLHAGDQAAA